MPLARIEVRRSRSPDEVQALIEAVFNAGVSTGYIPKVPEAAAVYGSQLD